MTRFERQLLVYTGILGVALTLLVVFVDRLGWLKKVEWLVDDARAQYFQYFHTPPTDQLVHLDIDDETLDFLGSWPWPRSKLAKIVHELDLAGAKVVDFDVIFSEAQDPTITDPSLPPIDHDKLFAQSLQDFRRTPGRGVLMPMSVPINQTEQTDPIYLAMVGELIKDLELEDEDLVRLLQKRGFNQLDLHQKVAGFARHALDQAMFERVKHELDQHHPAAPDWLRAKLLPRSATSGIRTASVQTLERVLPRVESFESLLRFMRPVPAGLPPLLSQETEESPIPALAKAAAYSGFVELWQADDGKVRFLPLWIVDRGRMVPQMGLALACAQLGVDTNDLKLAPDSVTIPLPHGDDIVIPVYTRHDREDVGMLMDIPWFGNKDWQTMYDWPNHKESAQHVPMTEVWDICRIEPDIEDNNRQALEAVAEALGQLSSPDDAQNARLHHPDFLDAAGWNKFMSDTVDSLPPGTMDDYQAYINGSQSIESLNSPREQALVYALRNLAQRPAVNSNLMRQQIELREKLRRKLNGKAVLIGWIATGTVDFRTTPLGTDVPGVVVHGAVFNAIMTRYFLYRAPPWVAMMLTLTVGFLVTVASSVLPPWRALFSMLSITLVFLVFDFVVAYDWQRIEVDAAGPLTAALPIYIAITLTRFIRERREKRQITSRFQSYADPSLVKYVLEHPDQVTFEGEERELSVVFTDLAGFTSVSEMLKRETVPLLNEYLGRMEPVIRKHHGLVNKFLGDGIMFFFGAPEPYPGDPNLHAIAAVETVLEMQRVMIPFNEELARRNLPELKMRAGVSTGDMVVGDAGTPQRSDYTVLGDRVNFASRLESANKATGTLILVSDRTVELLQDRYLVRPVGRLQVVGKQEPVMSFEPLALKSEATPQMYKLVEMTNTVIESYIASRFADCLAATHELLQTFGDASQGKLCALYRRLSMEYLRIPPKDFLGQIKLESK